jgi:hypothetical protein
LYGWDPMPPLPQQSNDFYSSTMIDDFCGRAPS